MMNIKWRDDEQMFQSMEQVFSDLYEKNRKITQYNHYNIWQESGKLFTPQDWKAFLTDTRVNAWFNQELELIARAGVFESMERILTEGNRSTADVQTMTQLLNYVSKSGNQATDNKVYIYSFMPLNEQEAQAPNVKVLENIPTEIDNALQRYTKSK